MDDCAAIHLNPSSLEDPVRPNVDACALGSLSLRYAIRDFDWWNAYGRAQMKVLRINGTREDSCTVIVHELTRHVWRM